jgi:putative membrane protein
VDGTPDASTKLALDRTRLAHERTLMAWVRTATSLISFGFTMYKFFAFQAETETHRPLADLVSPRAFGSIMICTGIVSLVFAPFSTACS